MCAISNKCVECSNPRIPKPMLIAALFLKPVACEVARLPSACCKCPEANFTVKRIVVKQVKTVCCQFITVYRTLWTLK